MPCAKRVTTKDRTNSPTVPVPTLAEDLRRGIVSLGVNENNYLLFAIPPANKPKRRIHRARKKAQLDSDLELNSETIGTKDRWIVVNHRELSNQHLEKLTQPQDFGMQEDYDFGGMSVLGIMQKRTRLVFSDKSKIIITRHQVDNAIVNRRDMEGTSGFSELVAILGHNARAANATINEAINEKLRIYIRNSKALLEHEGALVTYEMPVDKNDPDGPKNTKVLWAEWPQDWLDEDSGEPLKCPGGRVERNFQKVKLAIQAFKSEFSNRQRDELQSLLIHAENSRDMANVDDILALDNRSPPIRTIEEEADVEQNIGSPILGSHYISRITNDADEIAESDIFSPPINTIDEETAI